MNLKHVIGCLVTAVIVLALVSGVGWFTMGKRTITQQQTTPVGVINTPQTHAFRATVK